MNAPIAGFSIWNWGWESYSSDYSWYWMQPEIQAAVQYLADMKP
jgi:hypothetical protein